tara:strand:- start:471 stop:1712 length:1242 start_codon:yes stop_codon:yes gene_type:complete
MADNIEQEIEMRSTKELIPYARNTRTHSEEQVGQIAASIKEFGFTNPILVDQDNMIIAGHGRVMAANKLDLKEVPTIRLDYLTEAQKRAYVIADNRLALNADWDYEMLKVELKELDDLEFDVNLLGFEDKEIDILLAEPTEGLTDEDEVPDLPDEPVTKLGDLWQLGNHRLLCGDSTSIDAVDTLMDGNKADMVFTDPPYNALKSWKKDEANSETRLNPNEWFANDNMEWEDYYEFIKTSLTNIKTNSLYVCCDFRIYPLLFNLLVEDEYEIKHCIVWYKNTWGLGKRYRFQHELIIYATKNNPKFVGDNSQSDVWNVAVDRTTEHKTPKPVELPLKAITNTIEVNKICVDLFLGSGSTLLACEKSARKCFGIELDPKYCDLIINRWQDFTGKEAVHLELNKTYNELNEHEND